MTFVWMLALFLRSGVYLGRITVELTTPYREFLPHITACASPDSAITDEEKYVLWYRSVGVKCEK